MQMIKRLSRLAYTLCYLKPTQLAFFILRRKLSAKTIRPEALLDVSIRDAFNLSSPITLEGGLKRQGCFEFLNIEQTCHAVDWRCESKPRLWAYNLHYFDYLRNTDIDDVYRVSLIDDWIRKNNENSQPGWEPFTCSLRSVNWIFFLSSYPQFCDSKRLASLYHQLLWLEKNDERHILANHYFENLKALLFGGVFFKGEDADRFRTKAVKGLKDQLKEQTLQDGGHYERSPQYHCLMLENYLDIYNLVVNNTDLFDSGFKTLVRETAGRGLRFLKDIVLPDRQIPLFGDSAFGIAPTLAQLESYAHQLFGYEIAPLKDGVIDKTDFGFYGIRHGRDMLLMDCGDIGPKYQPGHTHCDFLSYELMKDGQRIIVDTGVCEYAPGKTRQYLRSTSAHNTVVVNGLEQSEVWGEFRVARRAKKLLASVELDSDLLRIKGAFEGFYASKLYWKPDFSHSRQMDVKLLKDGLKSINVIDIIKPIRSDSESFSCESFIHIHPDFHLVKQEETADTALIVYALYMGPSEIAHMKFDVSLASEIRDTFYCPEFGRKYKNQCLVLTVKGAGTVEFGYSIVFT